MQLTIKGLKLVGELVALAIIATIWMGLCGGELWQALYLLAAACAWFVFGREIKRPKMRKLAGVATVVGVLTLGYFLAGVAYAQLPPLPTPCGQLVCPGLPAPTPSPGGNCQLVTVCDDGACRFVEVCQ